VLITKIENAYITHTIHSNHDLLPTRNHIPAGFRRQILNEKEEATIEQNRKNIIDQYLEWKYSITLTINYFMNIKDPKNKDPINLIQTILLSLICNAPYYSALTAHDKITLDRSMPGFASFASLPYTILQLLYGYLSVHYNPEHPTFTFKV